MKKNLSLATLVLGTSLLIASSASAVGFQKLVDFNSTTTGTGPFGSLTLGSNGLFYGGTTGGGANNDGTLFSYDPTNNDLTTLVNFNSTTTGSQPSASLTLGSNGLFYGSTFNGGTDNDGTLFSYDPTTNDLTTLVNFGGFNRGANPSASLTLGNNGLFYGTTFRGGFNNDGTLFLYDPTTNDLLTLGMGFFNYPTEGSGPFAGLTLGSNGLFYGSTSSGGLNGTGTLFSYNPTTNDFFTLVDFDSTTGGAVPFSSLTLGSNGLLYGSTLIGGTNDEGTLFSYDPTTNDFNTLVSFDTTTTGSNPFNSALTLGSNGLLYGTTSGLATDLKGTLFSYDPTTNVLKSLVNFDTTTTGSQPFAGLTLGSNGLLYGTTTTGGANNSGTLFSYDARISTAVPEPSLTILGALTALGLGGLLKRKM